MNQSRYDLTEGGHLTTLIRFALPFLWAYLIQALYGAVDLLVVGKFGGGRAGVSAIASGSEAMHLLMSFIMGLTTGATVLIGQYYGAGNRRNVNRSVGMTMTLSLILSAVMTAVLIPFIPALLRLLKTPPEAMEPTYEYVFICALGIVFIFGYNTLSAIFRGFGNSTAPLVFVGIACGFNIAGDLLLTACLGMGVRGAAIATVASQALSMFCALWYLYKRRFGFRFLPGYFLPAWELVKRFLTIGLPIALQGILISLSFMFIFVIVNSMGVAASAGYGIVGKINSFAMLPAGAFSMAVSAITAQNIGANKPDRALRILGMAVFLTLCFGLFSLLLLQFFPGFMIGLFIDVNSPGADEVIRQGTLYVRGFSWDYLMVPVVFCTNGFFNGCGRTFFSMCNNLMGTFLFRIPVSWYFSTLAGASLLEVGLAAPLASLSSNIVAVIFLLSGRWRQNPGAISKV